MKIFFFSKISAKDSGPSGKSVPGQFTGEEMDFKNLIPAKAHCRQLKRHIMRTIPALAISLSRQDGAPLALMGTRRYAARQTPNAREKNAHKALCYETTRTGRMTPIMNCRGRMTLLRP